MAMRRKGKRKPVDVFTLLPDEILLDILKRVPDAYLGNKAKYVCRRWLNLISNRIFADPSGSFILHHTCPKIWNMRRVCGREEIQKEQVVESVMTNLDLHLRGKIKCWGPEFVLISDYNFGKKGSLYVHNLITKEGSYLPEHNYAKLCGGKHYNRKCGLALSVDLFTGEYKVVHLFLGPPIECHVLILRMSRDIINIVSQKWKKMKIQAPCSMNVKMLTDCSPISVQGRCFHWLSCDDPDYRSLVSMDVVKKKVVRRVLPSYIRCGDAPYNYFEMGGSLGVSIGDIRKKAEIWSLKDFQRNNWEKMHSITLEDWPYRRYPVCGLMMSESNRYIILKDVYDYSIWHYDLNSGLVKKLPGLSSSNVYII